MTTFPPAWDKDYAFFFHRKNSFDKSKYFQNIEAYFSKEQILFHKIFTCSEIDTVPKAEAFLSRTLLHLEKDNYKATR